MSNTYAVDSILEAESQDLTNRNIRNGAVNPTKQYSGYIKFDFDAPIDGNYEFSIKGFNPEVAYPKIQITINADSDELKFSKGDQSVWQSSSSATSTYSLKKGINSVQLRVYDISTVVDAIGIKYPEGAPLPENQTSQTSTDTPSEESTNSSYIPSAPEESVYNPLSANERERLLDHVTGFGRSTTGGLGGNFCHVTSLEDSGSGTLRSCAQNDSPVWVVFDVSGTINLSSAIRVGSNTTIDGRGANITVTGAGLNIEKRENVIIHNLEISNLSKDDAVKIYSSQNVWIDHVTAANTPDGLIDITEQSKNVTVSWCKLTNHNKTMLIGSNNSRVEDEVITVTLHHNHHYRTIRRNPNIRYASVHMYNNLIDQWGAGTTSGDGVNSTYTAKVYLENNIFNPDREVTRAIRFTVPNYQDVEGYLLAKGNLMLGGLEEIENKPELVFNPNTLYQYKAEEATLSLKESIENGAGRRDNPSWQASSTLSQEEVTEVPAQEEVAEVPAQEEVTEVPAQEEVVEEPAQEEVAEVPAQEEVAEAPAQEEVAEVPAQEEVAEENNLGSNPVFACAQTHKRPGRRRSGS